MASELGAPEHHLETAIVVLDDRRAAFDPVAAIEIVDAVDHAIGRVMDMAADDAVGVVPAGFAGDGLLEGANEAHGPLDAVFEISREGPIPEPQMPAQPVQGIVELKKFGLDRTRINEVVGIIADCEGSEPRGRASLTIGGGKIGSPQ